VGQTGRREIGRKDRFNKGKAKQERKSAFKVGGKSDEDGGGRSWCDVGTVSLAHWGAEAWGGAVRTALKGPAARAYPETQATKNEKSSRAGSVMGRFGHRLTSAGLFSGKKKKLHLLQNEEKAMRR